MGIETARQGKCFRGFPHASQGGVWQLSRILVNIDVLLTWGTNRFTSMPVRQTRRAWQLELLVQQTRFAWTEHADGFQHPAFATGQYYRVCFYVLWDWSVGLRSWPVRDPGLQRAGFPFPGLHHCHLFRGELFALGIIGEYLARMYFQIMESAAVCAPFESQPCIES